MIDDNSLETNTPVLAMLETISTIIRLDRFYNNSLNEQIIRSFPREELLCSGNSIHIVVTILLHCRFLTECYIRFLLKKGKDLDAKDYHCGVEKFEEFSLAIKAQRNSLTHGWHIRKSKINEFHLDTYNDTLSPIMDSILENSDEINASFSEQLVYCTFEVIKALNKKHRIDDELLDKQNTLIMQEIDKMRSNKLGAIVFDGIYPE